MATIAVDWDLTLVDDHNEWLPGAYEALQRLTMGKHAIIIHSSALASEVGRKRIEHRLEQAGFLAYPYLQLVEKPWADIYIDDRGLRFEGDWRPILSRSEFFK